LEKTYPVECKL